MFMSYVKMCKYCAKTPKDDLNGYYPFIGDDKYICPICNLELCETILTQDEYLTIAHISRDNTFIQAMIKLKEDDIIEFRFRISQFETQLQQQKQVDEKKQKEIISNQPHCPTCGSSNLAKVSTFSKIMDSAVWGFGGRQRYKTYHCNDCGYEW